LARCGSVIPVAYSRRAIIASVLLVLYGLVFAWLAVGVRMDPGTATRLHLDVAYGAMRWIATIAIVCTTVSLMTSGLAPWSYSRIRHT
jgi:hypothetical protein